MSSVSTQVSLPRGVALTADIGDSEGLKPAQCTLQLRQRFENRGSVDAATDSIICTLVNTKTMCWEHKVAASRELDLPIAIRFNAGTPMLALLERRDVKELPKCIREALESKVMAEQVEKVIELMKRLETGKDVGPLEDWPTPAISIQPTQMQEIDANTSRPRRAGNYGTFLDINRNIR